MTLAAALDLPADLAGQREWAMIATPAQMAEIDAAQQGPIRLQGRLLTTGDYLLSADWLSDETGYFAPVVAALSPETVAALRCARIEAVRTLVALTEDEPPFPWVQIAGADTGPQGAVSGYPINALVSRFNLIWRSRVQFNVNEPRSDGVPTTWSRVDGRFVVPAGWQFQPGEDLTADDGVTWFRVAQATSFSPSAFPAAYVQIDGPGGQPVVVAPPVLPWVQPQPGVPGREPYPVAARVTHSGRTWTSTTPNNVWAPGVFGWTPD